MGHRRCNSDQCQAKIREAAHDPHPMSKIAFRLYSICPQESNFRRRTNLCVTPIEQRRPLVLPKIQFQDVGRRIAAAFLTFKLDGHTVPARTGVFGLKRDHLRSLNPAMLHSRSPNHNLIFRTIEYRDGQMMKVSAAASRTPQFCSGRHRGRVYFFRCHNSSHRQILRSQATLRPTTEEIGTRARMSSRNEGVKRMGRGFTRSAQRAHHSTSPLRLSISLFT